MKMRKFLALAAVLLGLSLSVPASAQTGGLLGVLSGGRSISNTLNRSCSYGGLSQITCQLQRADSISRQFDSQRRQMQNRQRQADQRVQRVNQALVRACKLGDQESCERAGPALDPKQTQLQQALRQACDAGDSYSCRRADAMRQQTYAQQSRYRYADRGETAYAQPSRYRTAPVDRSYDQPSRYREADGSRYGY
jgi:preprotein translocase subunit SecD